VYQTEKVLREQGDKLDGTEKAQVEEHLATLKTAVAGTDIDAIRAATEALATSSQALTQKLYDAAAQADREAGGGAAGGPQPSDDDVVDAEIIDDEAAS
jgi:molecular chaperone DnaK